MSRRVQIVAMEKGSVRWKFIAHGAPYDLDEAEQLKVRREALGDKIRFLAIRKS